MGSFMIYEHPFFVIMAIYNNLHHLWEFMLTFEQLRCVVMGVTVNEWINRDRYGYVREIYGLYISDFSLGFVPNVKRFFCGKASSKLVYNISEKPSKFIESMASSYENYTKNI